MNQPSCASVPSAGDSPATPGHAPGTTDCVVDGKLAEIVGHIDRHICDLDLGATSLQAAFHLSRPTLYRMFQPLGGVSQHIRRRRVLVAHQHLRQDPDCSITWLLYEAGFTSERQFQRAFRAAFGLSPVEWRERCRKASQQRWRNRRRPLSIAALPDSAERQLSAMAIATH